MKSEDYKSIVIGNGINIQFGGSENTNRSIVERAVTKLSTNNFPTVAYPKETESLLRVLHATIPNILSGKYDIYAVAEHEKSELINFKSRTRRNAQVSDIGFEDYFLINDLLSRKANLTNDEIYCAHEMLKRLFLDAIYNDGRVNNIYLNFPEQFKEYIRSFDQVFTTNYDHNLEIATSKEIGYLHGGFHVLDAVYDLKSLQNMPAEKAFDGLTDFSGYEYLFSTAIASSTGAHKKREIQRSGLANSALEKYALLYKNDPQSKKKIDGFKNSQDRILRRLYETVVLKSNSPEVLFPDQYAMKGLYEVTGSIVFLGLSPNNDSHIINAVKNNTAIDTVIFYYYEDSEVKNIEGLFSHKKLEIYNARGLWETMT